MWRDVTKKDKEEFNKLAPHHFQSYEWGVFRERAGIKVLRRGFFVDNILTQVFQMTLHPIPNSPWNIGYLPKGNLPTKELIEELKKIGKEHKCIFIEQEPHVSLTSAPAIHMLDLELRQAAHPMFAKYNVEFDLTKSEEELLKAMHDTARYDVKLAQKRGVVVEEINTPEAIDIFWPLMQETMRHKHAYCHSKDYYQAQWESLPHNIMENKLSWHMLCAQQFSAKPIIAFWFISCARQSRCSE